jgi:hypothetical protein
MTKKRKIKLLVNDNKKLMEENKRLHELNNEELGNKMISEMEHYSNVIEKLSKKYIELDRLRVTGIRNRQKYIRMLWVLKMRKLLGV